MYVSYTYAFRVIGQMLQLIQGEKPLPQMKMVKFEIIIPWRLNLQLEMGVKVLEILSTSILLHPD